MSICTIHVPHEALCSSSCVSQGLHQVDTEFLVGESSAAGDLELREFGAASRTAALGKWSVWAPQRC